MVLDWARQTLSQRTLRRSAEIANKSQLLLEQILESLPSVAWAQGGRSGRLFFPGYANFVERAFVAGVFFGDALGHGLHALEAAAGIEIHALFAGVQFEAALRTFASGRSSLQHRAALGAARDCVGAGQIDGPGTERVVPLRRGRT
jgi:hypothetical protein